MPELPEVETVRRGLAAHLPGRRVVAVRARDIAMRRPLEAGVLRAGLLGRHFLEPARRAKYLLLDTDGPTLMVHLGMSGRMLVGAAAALVGKHRHLELELDDGVLVAFEDPRRFGFAVLLDDPSADPALAKLGPEPFDPGLDEHLSAAFARTSRAIKAVLLDQTVVAGLGNIYADEALWRARIRPTTPARRIGRGRVRRLAKAIVEVLGAAIDQGGTTLRDFARPDGWAGYFQVHLEAYGRAGEPCSRCARALTGTRVAGRATVFCRRCQR